MTPFEYVSVLISIILGLGITQIMSGIADLVHQWDRVKLYWPHLLWIVLVFVMQIQEWWVTYQQLHVFNAWRLATFLFFVLYPVNLFILARILFPLNPPDGAIDLKQFYFGNFRKFFLCSMTLIVLSVITNVIVEGVNASQLLHVSLFAVVGWVSWRNYHMGSLHKLLALGLLTILVVSIITNWDTWLIG